MDYSLATFILIKKNIGVNSYKYVLAIIRKLFSNLLFSQSANPIVLRTKVFSPKLQKYILFVDTL